MSIQRDSIPLGYVLSSPFVLIVYYFSIHPILLFAYARPRLGTWVPNKYVVLPSFPSVPGEAPLFSSALSELGALPSFPSLLGAFPW